MNKLNLQEAAPFVCAILMVFILALIFWWSVTE
jgi:hypothetical protein